MAPVSEEQLELFDLGAQPTPRQRHDLLRGVTLRLRYDQLVLGSLGSVLGLTLVFAGGVERGKQLTRGEPAMLERRAVGNPPAADREGATREAGEPSGQEPPVTTGQPARASPPFEPAPRAKAAKKLAAAPATVPPPGVQAAASKQAQAEASRYAVQVVAFSKPDVAKREMDRLRARGERAFLVMRQGRTMVYIGPFPSRGHANKKVATLKNTYQDCFVRTL